MAREVINVGAAPNDGTGDPIRTAYIKCNTNFGELYARVQTTPPPTLVGTPGDLAGMYAYDSNWFYYCFQDYDGSSVIWGQVGGSTPVALQNGTSNVAVAASGPVTFGVAGVSNAAVITAENFAVVGNIVAGEDVTATGTVTATNLDISGDINVLGQITVGNLIPAANVTYDLGSATSAWRDLYLSGSTIYLDGATITANATAMTLTTETGASFVVGGTGGNSTGSFGTVSVTGNVTAANVVATNNVVATGNVSGQYVFGDGSFLTNVTAVGNVAVTQIANGTSRIGIAGTNGYGQIDVAGVANVAVFTSAGAYIAGVLEATGNIQGGNIDTTGNIIAGNVIVTGSIQGNVESEGTIQVTDTTDSTSPTSGSLVAAGGLGVAGNAYIGGLVSATGNIVTSNTVSGNIISGNTVNATNFTATTGSISTATITTLANITAVTNSISTTTGALTVAGGVGVGGNLYLGGLLDVTGNVQVANITATGNANVAFLDVVSRINVLASAQSVSTTTGAITVLGGVGVGGNVYVGESVVAAGDVIADYFIGDGSLLTGITANYGNANVAAYLPTYTGDVSLGNIINANANGIGNIGSSTTYFNTVFAKATSAEYADLAEYYLSDQAYEPGTVLKFGGVAEVTIADTDADPTIVGVVSTAPAYIMNAKLVGQHSVAVALMGRVPVKVRGPVRRGQMLVSAGDGYARAEDAPPTGTVIGKAVKDFNGEVGVVEVVVGRL
jgi:hypothetical protein